jgi:hypothetical protein
MDILKKLAKYYSKESENSPPHKIMWNTMPTDAGWEGARIPEGFFFAAYPPEGSGYLTLVIFLEENRLITMT